MGEGNEECDIRYSTDKTRSRLSLSLASRVYITSVAYAARWRHPNLILLCMPYDKLGSSNSKGTFSSSSSATMDPSLLWRQDMRSPEIPRSETHSPLLLQRKGFDSHITSTTVGSSAAGARSAASVPTSPLFGAHSSDHLNHIWAPSVSSPATAEFPRSPSPLFHLQPLQQQHQSHSSLLYQSLTPTPSMRSPLSASSTLRNEISDSLELDEPWRQHPSSTQSELDYALASDDCDDRSSQLKSVLNAALDVGEDERMASAINARSPLFSAKFAPPQRSSSTPPTQGHPLAHSRYPPGFSLVGGNESSQAELEFGMQNMHFGGSVSEPAQGTWKCLRHALVSFLLTFCSWLYYGRTMIWRSSKPV